MRKAIKEVNQWIENLIDSEEQRNYYQTKPMRMGERIICIDFILEQDKEQEA